MKKLIIESFTKPHCYYQIEQTERAGLYDLKMHDHVNDIEEYAVVDLAENISTDLILDQIKMCELQNIAAGYSFIVK